MGGVINNPPFINTFHNPSASLVGTIVTIYEIGCCAGRQYHHSACRRTSRSTKVHLYRRVHHPRWDGSEGGSCLALAWYVKGLWLMRRSLGPDLLTGLPQLDQPSPPIRSLAKSRSRSIRLLPALVCFQLSCLNSGIMLAYWVGYVSFYLNSSRPFVLTGRRASPRSADPRAGGSPSTSRRSSSSPS